MNLRRNKQNETQGKERNYSFKSGGFGVELGGLRELRSLKRFRGRKVWRSVWRVLKGNLKVVTGELLVEV